MKSFTSWIKILFINLGVFLLLLFLTETALRVLWTGSTCSKKACDFSRLVRLQVYDVPLFDKNIGLSEFNDTLGYRPKPGFKEILNSTG